MGKRGYGSKTSGKGFHRTGDEVQQQPEAARVPAGHAPSSSSFVVLLGHHGPPQHPGRATGLTSSAVERARRAVERRLATTIPFVVAAEASAILTRLKSMMWEDIGVIRVGAVRHDRRGQGALGGGGARLRRRRGERETVALRETRRAPALANRISGGCHYVVPASSEGE